MDVSKFSFSYKGKTLNAHIGSAPNLGNENQYIDYFNSNDITTIVRCCNDSEVKYNEIPFINNHIIVIKVGLIDGSVPTTKITEELSKLYGNLFSAKKSKTVNIFFHCVSGLGRAPTWAAYIVCKHMKADPANYVIVIRKQRTGAINNKQLHWIIDQKYESPACIVC
jgi:protein-tyrosine phosphatase